MRVESDDEQKVTAAKSGDQGAWEELLLPLYPRLHAYIGRRAARDHIEDLVNETMTRAVAGVHQFTWGPAGFDGWVFGIARRVTADHHRTNARAIRYSHSAQILSDDGGHELDEELIRSDDEARIRQCFHRLDPADREVLELRVIGQLSAEKVAAVLGKRPGAVRTAQSRALGRLREMMEFVDV